MNNLEAVAYSSKKDTWATPQAYFDQINARYHFDLDAAAAQDSTKVPANWYGLDHEDITRRDAFTREWSKDGSRIWLNPPYGRTIAYWLAKADQEAQGGGNRGLFNTGADRHRLLA